MQTLADILFISRLLRTCMSTVSRVIVIMYSRFMSPAGRLFLVRINYLSL
jgi:hypothetical protein